MAKLTKAQSKLHSEAEALLAKDTLTDEDREFVLDHWQESAGHDNARVGAFFTPAGLARDLTVELPLANLEPTPVRIIDLCAGIGALSLAAWWMQTYLRRSGAAPIEITCVELNADYVAVGRKMLPEAKWVQASVFDLPDLGHFDVAISNPPFGKINKDGAAPRYRGAEFEYAVIDVAADLADHGAFIVPQTSAPFDYSGKPYYQRSESEKYQRFHEQTGITLDHGCGVDTSIYLKEWKGVAPMCEIVVSDFRDREQPQPEPGPELEPVGQIDLFGGEP